MNKTIKLTCIILILILLMVQFSTIAYAIIEDTTPPNIISVSSDKNVLKTGETITFNVKVEDDISGAKSFFVQWNLKTDNTKTITKQYDSMQDEGTYQYTIPENTIAGQWEATHISICDNMNNEKLYNKNGLDDAILSKFDFTVEDTNQDTEAPIVTNVKRITTNITAPAEVVVQYDVVDNNSGVQQNYGGVTYSPANDLSITKSGSTKKISGNTYQSTFYLNSQYEKYVFAYIQVCDNAGNSKNYTNTDLGLTNELDIIPNNYKEDKTAPKLVSIDYDTTEVQIPDYLQVTFDIEEKESGLDSFLGRAYFKSDDGKYDKELTISRATDSNGAWIENKGSVRLDFGDAETFRGKIHLYKITLTDKMNNTKTYSLEKGDFTKQEITISKVEKNYTLTTSSTKKDYINEISKLPEGSTVLCNVLRGNQIIEKELFDAIKGKDITITFMSLYNANWEVISTSGELSSSDTNTGIQWIINGKDITNETKDIDMTIKISKKMYSKYILPEYEINENLEMDFWSNVDFDNMSDEEIQSKEKELIKLQEEEIKKYFDKLKQDGYTNIDEAYKNALELINENVGYDCKSAIIYSNDYVEYLSIKFAENGTLPCKTIIRMKPTYAMRALIGVKDLNLYYIDGESYDLVDDNVKVDTEKYYNFTIYHNSEYCLTNGLIEKLSKAENTNNTENIENEKKGEKDNTPKTGEIDIISYVILTIVIAGIGIVALKKKLN